jgi:NADH dehydrogenase
VTVAPDLTLPDHPEVAAIGDMALVRDAAGNPIPLPGIAPVAMQQGRHAARVIRSRLRGREAPAFRYRDKGNLATIGRGKGVADVKGLQLSGHVAWLTWLFVHLFYLIGLRNRIVVFIHWTFSFVTRGRGARLVTEQALTPASQPARRTLDRAS